MQLASIKAYQVLDSRGEPTVRVAMTSESGLMASFDAPSGTSVSGLEAKEARDGEQAFGGHGTTQNARFIEEVIAPRFIAYPLGRQADFDALIVALDGSEDKSSLGTNTLTALSGAYFLLSCLADETPVWKAIAGQLQTKPAMPRLYAAIVAGGAHAPGLDLQEFMIVPKSTSPIAAAELIYGVRSTLQSIFQSLYGPAVTLSTDEGAMAPIGATAEVVLEALQQLNATYQNGYDLALDAAANHFFADGGYTLANQKLSMQELGARYIDWDRKFPLLSVEDPFAEQDAEGLKYLATQPDKQFFVVGDDSTATDPTRITSLAAGKLIGGVVIKPNQVGTITDTFKAIEAAQAAGLKIIISHRAGESNDTFLADLAYAIGAFGFKLGSPQRGERVAKYNRLIELEMDLGLAPARASSSDTAAAAESPAPLPPAQPSGTNAVAPPPLPPMPPPIPQPELKPLPPAPPSGPDYVPSIPARDIHSELNPAQSVPAASALHSPNSRPYTGDVQNSPAFGL